MSHEQPLGPSTDAREAALPAATTLRGQYVHLTPVLPDQHAAQLFPLVGGPEHHHLWTYMFDGPFDDQAQLHAYLRRRSESADSISFAITDAKTTGALGLAALMRIDPRHRVIEVGNIMYSPHLQRTRGATEAMYLLARHVFEDLGYRRYEWKCDSLNAPSRRAAERLGFTFEGVFRQHMILRGHSRDTAWYSMLDHEWPSRRAAFERWLSPANFDESGKQLSSLGMRVV